MDGMDGRRDIRIGDQGLSGRKETAFALRFHFEFFRW